VSGDHTQTGIDNRSDGAGGTGCSLKNLMEVHMTEFEMNLAREQKKYDELTSRKNRVDENFYNGIYDRYENPVLTREMIPLFWRYDMNPASNPHFMERLGVNAVMRFRCHLPERQILSRCQDRGK
jgi:hypothetical protein